MIPVSGMSAHRPIVMTEAGVVASGHHRASEAGAAVLRDGGNAIDAAVATSAVLSVAIPHMSGLGGDAIALYYEARSGQTFSINGSGRAPSASSVEAIRAAGHARMPSRGPLTISVCGLVDAWRESLDRFGTRDLGSLLAPAARLARAGVPVDASLMTYFESADYARIAASFPELVKLYGKPGSRRLGERIANPALATTIESLGRRGARDFYEGENGARLIADLGRAGVPLDARDMVSHQTLTGPSLVQDFASRRLHVAPPNSQGIALAVMAGLCDLDRAAANTVVPLEPLAFLQRKEIAFGCRAQIDDVAFAGNAAEALTEKGLRRLLADRDPNPGSRRWMKNAGGDTSTLVVMDRWGNAVSWVQSLFEDFGSGVVSPSTGIVMHSRLSLQGLYPGELWPLRAGRRPFHTLCPALLVANGRCELAIATPGDHGQPQSIMQVLHRLYGEGLDIQSAIEAPRLRHDEGRKVMLEERAPTEWRQRIEFAGYEVELVGSWSRLMGGVNAIVRNADGLMMAGADPRRSCYALSAD